MTTDASRKLIGFRIYQEFCRMFPMGLGNVNPVEMSPFLMTMRLIKQFYGFSKPEVYSTLIALLQDYDPSLGLKHCERTMRYIRLLLVDQPDLADYLLYLLPESTRPSDSEESRDLQHPAKCVRCSAHNPRCEKMSTAESLLEEPRHGSSLLQRMVTLPATESSKDFSTSTVRIAPAVNAGAGIPTTANSFVTFGKSSKIALPHLVKNATGQVKQLQVQSKPTTLNTLLYSPNIVIKSEILTDASSVVTLPRMSSTSAGATSISSVQDAANSLARHLGLKLATRITALPKDGTDKAVLSNSKAPLLKMPSRVVLENSCNRTSEMSLDGRLENIIKKFGKETQTSTGRFIGMPQQTVDNSILSSGVLGPKLSCVRNNESKETLVLQKRPELTGRGTQNSVANGFMRIMPTFPQSQPMLVIEKARGTMTSSSLDSAGIRIIKKSKVSTDGLHQTKIEKLPLTVPESSPLISLKKLVAGVGLVKGFEHKTISHSDAVISNRDAALNSRTCAKATVCDEGHGDSEEDPGNDGVKEAVYHGAMHCVKGLLGQSNSEVQEKHHKNKTKTDGGSFTSAFENCFEKESCHLNGVVESEGGLSPYSDEASHSLFMNDGTSDYHVSDEEQAPTTGEKGSTKHEVKGSNGSLSGEPSRRNATSAIDFDACAPAEEPLYKKMRVTASTDDNSQYEGSTYLARLMELPSPPNYGHNYPWDLIADDRKTKGKIAMKRKRRK